MTSDKTFYTTAEEIKAHYKVELSTLVGTQWDDERIDRLAERLTRELLSNKSQRSRNGYATGLGLLQLGKKVEVVLALMQDTQVTPADIVSIYSANARTITKSAERMAEAICLTASILYDFGDHLPGQVSFQSAQESPASAMRRLFGSSWSEIICDKPETIRAYRRYAALVASGKLGHQSFPVSCDDKPRASVALMPIGLVKRELAAYEKAVSRAKSGGLPCPAPDFSRTAKPVVVG